MRFLCCTRAACALLALCCASAHGQERPLLSAIDQTSVGVAQAVSPVVANDPGAIRHRFAAIEVDRLSELHGTYRSRQGAAAEPRGIAITTDSLTLNLFDDVVVTGLIDRAESTIGDGFVVSGGVADGPVGDFVLAVVGNAVAGMVHVGGSHYEILPAGDGLIDVIEMDPLQFDCGAHLLAASEDDREDDRGDDRKEAKGDIGLERDAGEGSGGEAAAQVTAAPASLASAQVFATEKAALEALYASAGGSDWERKDGWLSNAPVGTWYGIRTHSNGRVWKILLDDNGLVGTLPEELSSLGRLKVLYLQQNPGLEGTLPASMRATIRFNDLQYYGTELCVPDSGANRSWLWGVYKDGHYCQSRNTTEIAIAVPFTSKVRRLYGGLEGARARAATMVASANRALAESGALVQLDLVAAQETRYEHDDGTLNELLRDLGRLKAWDGHMDDVLALSGRGGGRHRDAVGWLRP